MQASVFDWRDPRRMQLCWAMSLGFHVAGLGFYFLWQNKTIEHLEIIDSVDFLELTPDEIEKPAAPEKIDEPKSFFEAVKQTITKIQKETILEEPPPPSAPKRPDLLNEAQAPKPIDLKTGLQGTRPEIALETRRAPTAANIADIQASVLKSNRGAPTALSEAPVALEEVGSVKVARSPIAAPSPIALRGSSRGSALMDQSSPTPISRRAAAPVIEEASAVSLDKGHLQKQPVLTGSAPDESLLLRDQKGSQLASENTSSKDLFSTPGTGRPMGASKGVLEQDSKKATEISGPIANRKILKSHLPEYPPSFSKGAMAAQVTLQFWVSAQGSVRDKIFIQQTSGYKELDERAMEALKGWLFESSSEQADQWGVITFRYVAQ